MSKVTNLFLTLIILAVTFHNSGFAQSFPVDSLKQKNRLKTEFRIDVGNVLPTNSFVRTQNTDADGLAHFSSYSLRLAQQTMGNQLWQQLYGYPNYGVGIYSAFFKDTKKLGNPIAIYGYFNAPFYRLNRLSLNYELGLGLTFNWNSYSPATNPNNIAISAEKSVYIDAGISLKYLLTRRIEISLGYGFTHFSNGALKLPNKGLNTEATKISLSYSIGEPLRFKSLLKPPFQGSWEWIIAGYGGARNMLYQGTGVDVATSMKGVNFAVYGLSNILNRQVSYKSKIGLGITMEFNGSQNSQIIVEGMSLEKASLPFDRHLAFSIYPSYELVVNKLSLIIQPGIYLFRMKSADMTPIMYQRIGVKYHFLKDTFFGINLRAYNYYESDFIEWTLGHRITW
ncbi:MAG: acyloxyacyl hydrolase [Mariniphaga sp.]